MLGQPGNAKYSPEFRARICDMASAGASHREIGKLLGISRAAVAGIIHRVRDGYIYKRETPKEERQKNSAFHVLKPDLKPAKYPFAPDDTCPDFAHDDEHCAAVLAQGGFPALVFRRAA